MELTPGTKLFSATTSAQVVVVRAPAGSVDLRCAGEPMVLTDAGASDPSVAPVDELQIGKRYADADGSIELLCARAGAGPLTVDGVPLPLKAAKPLPASD